MNITDETLSAFLDAELPAAEMEAVRNRIAEDEAIANRLAELAAVDTQVRETYSAIDNSPLPTAVTDLLSAAKSDGSQSRARILRFPTVRRQHLAMAASIAFAVGFGLSHWLGSQSTSSHSWSQIAAALDTTPSGQTVALAANAELTPRISFTNAQGLHCRQYDTRSAHSHTQAVACRGAEQWHQVVTLTSEVGEEQPSDYQTASADNPINAVVEKMAVGTFLNRAEEAQAIANQWQAIHTNPSTNP